MGKMEEWSDGRFEIRDNYPIKGFFNTMDSNKTKEKIFVRPYSLL
jgi:hypothetical protein